MQTKSQLFRLRLKDLKSTVKLASALLIASLGAGIASPGFCDRLDSELVPPEVILPYAAAPAPVSAAASTAATQGYGSQPAPGQANQGNGASGFASMGGFSPQPGQPNPFAQKPADMLRKPPGTSFPTKGSNPNMPGQASMYGTPPAGSGATPPPAGTSLQQLNQQAANPSPAGQTDGDPVAVIETSKGRIVIRLFKKYAPITVKAFSEMAQSGFYNGLNFHRVEKGFVVQGGCPNGNGTGNFIPPGSSQPRFLPLEVSPYLRHNAPGVVAMARTPGNVNTASCQFYITLGAKSQLDNQYTVFGGVVQGMEVVNSIAIGDKIMSVTVN